jgi:hypothetical protein
MSISRVFWIKSEYDSISAFSPVQGIGIVLMIWSMIESTVISSASARYESSIRVEGHRERLL